MKKTIAALGLVALLGTSSCHIRIFGDGNLVESHPKEKTENSQKNKYGGMYVKSIVFKTEKSGNFKQIWIQSPIDPNRLLHIERLNMGGYDLIVSENMVELYAFKTQKCKHIKKPWMKKDHKITDLLGISTF